MAICFPIHVQLVKEREKEKKRWEERNRVNIFLMNSFIAYAILNKSIFSNINLGRHLNVKIIGWNRRPGIDFMILCFPNQVVVMM